MSRRILLIDDDQDDAEIFADALRELDSTTQLQYIADGLKALDILKTSTTVLPDIIFMDINMPTINGWECLAALRKQPALQVIPVIMYSTSNPEREGIVPADAGATGFLTKPNTFRELKSSLAELIGV